MRSPLARGVMALVCWWAVGASPVSAQTWSVQKLQASKAEWDKLLDVPMQVEGRMASILKNQLRLQKCDLTFTATEELARLATNAKQVELSGRLRKENGRITFDVGNLKSVPTDMEQFQTRELAIKGNRADEWYALADWARERGEFYDDAALKDAARLCLTRGIASEVRTVSKDDFQGRLKLADKAAGFKLPASVSQDLRHEAFRDWWQFATVNNPEGAQALAALEARLRDVWPDAFRPLANWPDELAAAYIKDPLVTFHDADPLEQRQLQRVFAAQVLIRRITLEAPNDGRNGNEIAEKLASAVPDQPALANAYRDKALDYRLSQIGKASRQEALALSDQFRQRNRVVLSVETLRKWLAARENERTSQADAPTLIALADDYRQWLKDDAKAIALLKAAHQLEPLSEDVLSRMKDLGLEQRGGRWEPIVNAAPVNKPSALPGSESPIAIGMTAKELQESIGQPQSRTIVATLGGVEEWWTFGAGEGSRLMIQLQRRRNESQSRVVRFENR
ncbi:MAG TPA: hypothetical protein VFG20_09555 [Planctomycetaceae bacterium]|nr:hypothetical protein [Planctomycetaceae bacterium]